MPAKGTYDLQLQGFPKNQLRGYDFAYSPGCGGSGAGFCYLPASFRYIWWRVYANSSLVFNRKFTLLNTDFKSYLNAGFDGICANSQGASQDYDVLLVYQADGGIFTEDMVVSRTTVSGSATLPFYLDFNSNQIPQPNNVNWGGIFYVVIDLKATGRMIGGVPATAQVMKTTNYDYDERL